MKITKNNKLTKKVVTRFAPSNTGYMHIGGAKAAILPYIFTKKHQGKFILRLDNTDAERSKDIYTEEIYRSMRWLNISHNTYFEQRNRLNRYEEITQLLLKKNLIYKSYEDKKDLEIIRKKKLVKKIAPTITRVDCTKEAEGNRPFCWRFDLNGISEEVIINDKIFGRKTFKNHLSDPVIKRSDGTFTYIYASVIDDIDYEISHIIRGVEHLSNALVQKAIGNSICQILKKNNWKVEFYHYPLFLDEKGKKLSKRMDSLNLKAMINFEPQSIWSFICSEKNNFIYSFDYKDFSINWEKISTNPQILDIKILESINKKLLQKIDKKMVEKRGGNWELWKLGCKVTYWKDFKAMSDKFKEAKKTEHYQTWLKNPKQSRSYMIETYKAWLGVPFGPRIVDLLELLKKS